MLSLLRRIFTLRQLVILGMAAVIAPFWIINYEGWLKEKKLDRILIETDKAISEPGVWGSVLEIWDSALGFILKATNNEYVVGGVVAALIFTFAPFPVRLWKYYFGVDHPEEKEAVPAPERRYISRFEGKKQTPSGHEVNIYFGGPRQEASEPDLSWWHAPITLDANGPSEIRNCTVSMRVGSRAVQSQQVQMRWRSDQLNGDTEMDLVAGRERLVPIALRREPNEERPKTRALLTDLRFFRDQEETVTIDRVFTLIVSWGGGEAVSPHYYRLKVPPNARQSNGHFVLEIVPESEAPAIDAKAGRRGGSPLIGPFG